METKVCIHCNVEKPNTNEYFAKKGYADGFDVVCKDCRNAAKRKKYAEDDEYRARTNKHNREMDKERRKNNPDEVRKYKRDVAKKLYDANPEKYRQKAKDWRLNNLEKAKEMRRKTYTENEKPKLAQDERYLENARKAKRAYKKRNPHKNIEYKQKRRSKKRNLPMTYSVKHTRRALKHFNHQCPICGDDITKRSNRNLDHWIPISHENCLGTTPDNIIPLCKYCNQSKGANLPLNWLLSKFDETKAHEIYSKIQSYLESQIAN